MMPIVNDSIMSFRAKSVTIDDPQDSTKSYKKDFPGERLVSYLDTGGQSFSLRTDPAFIKAVPWLPCGCSGDQPCNSNCDCGQGPGTLFFNTSWQIELVGEPEGQEGQEGQADVPTVTVSTRRLNGAWASGGEGSPNMDTGEKLTNIFYDEGINVGGTCSLLAA